MLTFQQVEETMQEFNLKTLHISYESGEYWVKIGDAKHVIATGLNASLTAAFADAFADVEAIAEMQPDGTIPWPLSV